MRTGPLIQNWEKEAAAAAEKEEEEEEYRSVPKRGAPNCDTSPRDNRWSPRFGNIAEYPFHLAGAKVGFQKNDPLKPRGAVATSYILGGIKGRGATFSTWEKKKRNSLPFPPSFRRGNKERHIANKSKNLF